jgi:hypothetical protein
MNPIACMHIACIVLTLMPVAGRAAAQEPREIAEQYRRARVGTMQANADEVSVNDAVRWLADSVVYEHPAVGVRMVGRTTVAEGIQSFLGATRSAAIELLSELTAPGVVAAEERVSFEVKREGGWTRETRLQLTVYEVREGRITRMIEYWRP